MESSVQHTASTLNMQVICIPSEIYVDSEHTSKLLWFAINWHQHKIRSLIFIYIIIIILHYLNFRINLELPLFWMTRKTKEKKKHVKCTTLDLKINILYLYSIYSDEFLVNIAICGKIENIDAACYISAHKSRHFLNWAPLKKRAIFWVFAFMLVIFMMYAWKYKVLCIYFVRAHLHENSNCLIIVEWHKSHDICVLCIIKL